jgi:hypothetical protein
MPDDELLERVRELRARGRSPKEIARALKLRPATVTPLIRRLAAAEPQEKEAPLIGCWVNQGWSSSVRFTGHPEWPDTGAGETGESGLVTWRIMQTLRQNVGDGNFHYLVGLRS